MSTAFRIGAAFLGWFALGLQYVLVMRGDIGPGPLGRTVNFFSYFTILCNLLSALALTAPWLFPRAASGEFLMRPGVRSAIASFMIVVAATYHWLLRELWDPQGWAQIVDATLHYVMPTLFVLDWLLFVPKGRLQIRDVPRWLIFPLAFVAWTLVHGAWTQFYPYPFIDAAALGYARVAVNASGLLVAFLILALAMTILDRFLAKTPMLKG